MVGDGLSAWLLVVPLTLITVRMLIPSDGLPVGEPSGSFGHGGVRVLPPSPVAGIAADDVVVAVDGRSIEEQLDRPTARAVAAGDPVSYRILHDGAERVLPIVLRDHRQTGEMLIEGAPTVVPLAVVLGLGVWLVRRRPDEPAAHVFLVFGAASMSLVLGILAFIEPLDLAARPWAVAWAMFGEAGFLVLGVAVLAFAVTFPSAGRTPRHSILPWCLAPIVMMVVLGLCYLAGWLSIGRLIKFDSLVGAVWLSVVALTVVVAIVRWVRYRRQLVARRQVQITLLGFGATVLPLLAINVFPNDIPGYWFALIVLPLPGRAGHGDRPARPVRVGSGAEPDARVDDMYGGPSRHLRAARGFDHGDHR